MGLSTIRRSRVWNEGWTDKCNKPSILHLPSGCSFPKRQKLSWISLALETLGGRVWTSAYYLPFPLFFCMMVSFCLWNILKGLNNTTHKTHRWKLKQQKICWQLFLLSNYLWQSATWIASPWQRFCVGRATPGSKQVSGFNCEAQWVCWALLRGPCVTLSLSECWVRAGLWRHADLTHGLCEKEKLKKTWVPLWVLRENVSFQKFC